MTLLVINHYLQGIDRLNGFADRVVEDLQTICPDPGLSINNYSGGITYDQTMSSPGCDLIAALVSNPCWIGVRGEGPDFSIDVDPGRTLLDEAGATVPDDYPGTKTVEIVYDVTHCNKAGRFAFDASGNKIPYPDHVLLFHELSHARDLCTGVLRAPLDREANREAAETRAVSAENDFRQSLMPSLPLRSGYEGGCNVAPRPDAPPRPASKTTRVGCFIATAAYGSALEPEVQFLNSVRDNILRQTRAGEDFFDRCWEHYYRLSPVIVQLMENDQNIKDLVRWLVVSPIVQYLQFVLRFPHSPVENLDDPWRSFLLNMRFGLEEWAKEIPLPDDFVGMSARAAAEEIEISLRYALRTHYRRQAYLDHLEELEQIPLSIRGKEKEEMAERLRSSGCSDSEIQRLLGRECHESE